MLRALTQNGLLILFTRILISLSCFSTSYASALITKDHKIISYSDVGFGKALVLIHAFPADKSLWKEQNTELNQHFRVITLDLWGFGESSPVDGSPIRMSDYADEVNELLEQLQINQAIIGGESMGGYVSLAFLSKYPQKVTGLILSNTQSIADSEEAKTKREASALDVLTNGTSSFINSFLAKAFSDCASDALKQELLGILNNQKGFALASGLRGMALRADASEILANTTIPILIISGDQDKVINMQQSKNMHALAKNSSLLILKNGGHLSNIEKPEQWNQAVIEHFK